MVLLPQGSGPYLSFAAEPCHYNDFFNFTFLLIGPLPNTMNN